MLEIESESKTNANAKSLREGERLNSKMVGLIAREKKITHKFKKIRHGCFSRNKFLFKTE